MFRERSENFGEYSEGWESGSRAKFRRKRRLFLGGGCNQEVCGGGGVANEEYSKG